MKKYVCRDICDVCHVLNHNTRALENQIKKVSRRGNGFIILGTIFGALIEHCLIEQIQKIAALDEQIGVLNAEIRKLRDKEGD